ncbi:hypothetical protein Phi39:1_gp33 [Cellulophaga phage phi39:1]|uniref:hypothetical protein n=1 Tax=Cellulophaga phage phi39:1 TaxID=1327993 RepID=UPI000351BEC8|nr:hypothetical protein Phi39:1_gp33 [Cellulophaga phage phi39:1]AGO49148.1 hypothetical protein Phi39:1_gp33 [Cellulophaga phage phi39:1]
MKKIIITPANNDIKIQVEAISIKSDFISLGFKTRSSFVSVVQVMNKKYKTKKNGELLQKFWNIRKCTAVLNRDLELIIENLKNE